MSGRESLTPLFKTHADCQTSFLLFLELIRNFFNNDVDFLLYIFDGYLIFLFQFLLIQ